MLARALGERLGDALDFDLEGNVIDAGHKAGDLLAAMVEGGEKTLCYFASSYLAQPMPEIAVLDLPFAITSRAQAYAALDGPLGQRLSEQCPRPLTTSMTVPSRKKRLRSPTT